MDMLRDVDDPASLAPIRASLKDGAHCVRIKAIYALGRKKDVDSANTLAGLLSDPDPWTRGTAAQSLYAMASTIQTPSKEGITALGAALSDNFWATRHYAARALGLLGDPGWPLLHDALESAKLDPCVVALPGIGLIGSAICEVAGRRSTLSDCDTAMVPEGLPHRFLNEFSEPMAMIWVYAGAEPERILVDPGYCVGTLSLPIK